jgi:hypothetical protein
MNPTTQPHELFRGVVPHPAEPARGVTFFADWRRAVEHLIDHVLTSPECEGWAIVAPQLGQHVDPADGLARTRLAQSARESKGVEVQALFDLYQQEAAEASRQAHILGWYTKNESCFVALGVSGVFVLVDGDVVVTTYLPGQGDAEAVTQSDDSRHLRRERHPMRRAAPPEEDRRRREAAWTDEERLFYRVFRPAVQFIRSQHHRARGLDGRLRKADAALLKDCLPRMSELRLDGWRSMREQARVGEVS